MEATGHLKSYEEYMNKVINHGYGKLTVSVESLKDARVKIVITCGTSDVFFIKRDR